MIQRLLLVFLLTSILFSCRKEPSENIRFDKAFGGSGFDNTTGIVLTPDGGYAVAGVTESSDGDLSGQANSPGLSADAWVFKINKYGELLWSKKFGGPGNDRSNSIINTADGGLMVAGASSALGGDVISNKGGEDVWLVRLDKDGTVQWKRNYGGAGQDIANSIIQDGNGDFVFAGNSSSNDGDVSNNKGETDAWVVKINSEGNIVWQKTFGGIHNETALKIINSPTGGYVVLGETSGDNSISGYHSGVDIFVINLAQDGSLVWQKAFGGSGADKPGSVVASHSGGFVISGLTTSTDGDVHGSRMSNDLWLFEINNLGNLIWERAYQTPGVESAGEVISTTDGYSIARNVLRGDRQGSPNGSSDLFLMNVDLNGRVINQKKMVSLADGGAGTHIYSGRDKYVIAGQVFAPINGISGYRGRSDAWIRTVEY